MGIEHSAHAQWTFAAAATTGGLKAQNMRGYSERFSAYIETGPGCTATVRLESRAGSSAGPYATLGSTTLTTSVMNIQQFAGPLEWVRPYCVAKTTGVLTVELFGN